MDPANLIGVIGVVGQTIKLIYQYGDGVSECKAEVARLRAELFGLQAALSQVERDLSCSGLASPNLSSPDSYRVLEDARRLLTPLSQSLAEDISRTKRLAKRLVWPLKRQHVYDIATHLERLKTYFILAATNDTLQATREITASLQKLHTSIGDIKVSEERKAVESEALRWLEPYDSNPTHDSALSARMDGTNGWFLSGTLNDWLCGKSQMLWLTGQPGSGKTCLMAASIEKMIKLKDHFVAYFYCSSNHSASQEPRTILASLLAQLCRQSEGARGRVVEYYRRIQASRVGRPAPPDVVSLISLMEGVSAVLPKTILIFVDAVNECEEGWLETVQILLHIALQRGAAKLVLSSTQSAGHLMQDSLMNAVEALGTREIKVRQQDVTTDINKYIDTRFELEPRLNKLRASMQLQIKEEIRMKHHGSFRWAQCTVDDLATLSTPKAVRQALKDITPSLSDIYMAVLTGLPDSVAEVAHSMLLCLIPSHVGWLRLDELAEAAVYALAGGPDYSEDDRLIEPEAVILHLRSLVRYDPLTTKVEIAHSSVRDFLTSPQRSGRFYIDPMRAREVMARICVEYLTNPAFQLVCKDEDSLKLRQEDWPFFEYASTYWTRSIRDLTALPDSIRAPVSRLIATADLPSGGNWAAWYQCVFPLFCDHDCFDDPSLYDPVVTVARPLYMFAREGLTELLKEMLKICDKAELEQQGGARGSTPLHIAATYGRTEAVKLLLAAGADPNEENRLGQSGIRYAALGGHDETVQALLDGGADPALLNQELFEDVIQYDA